MWAGAEVRLPSSRLLYALLCVAGLVALHRLVVAESAPLALLFPHPPAWRAVLSLGCLVPAALLLASRLGLLPHLPRLPALFLAAVSAVALTLLFSPPAWLYPLPAAAILVPGLLFPRAHPLLRHGCWLAALGVLLIWVMQHWLAGVHIAFPSGLALRDLWPLLCLHGLVCFIVPLAHSYVPLLAPPLLLVQAGLLALLEYGLAGTGEPPVYPALFVAGTSGLGLLLLWRVARAWPAPILWLLASVYLGKLSLIVVPLSARLLACSIACATCLLFRPMRPMALPAAWMLPGLALVLLLAYAELVHARPPSEAAPASACLAALWAFGALQAGQTQWARMLALAPLGALLFALLAPPSLPLLLLPVPALLLCLAPVPWGDARPYAHLAAWLLSSALLTRYVSTSLLPMALPSFLSLFLYAQNALFAFVLAMLPPAPGGRFALVYAAATALIPLALASRRLLPLSPLDEFRRVRHFSFSIDYDIFSILLVSGRAKYFASDGMQTWSVLMLALHVCFQALVALLATLYMPSAAATQAHARGVARPPASLLRRTLVSAQSLTLYVNVSTLLALVLGMYLHLRLLNGSLIGACLLLPLLLLLQPHPSPPFRFLHNLSAYFVPLALFCGLLTVKSLLAILATAFAASQPWYWYLLSVLFLLLSLPAQCLSLHLTFTLRHHEPVFWLFVAIVNVPGVIFAGLDEIRLLALFSILSSAVVPVWTYKLQKVAHAVL
jgi:hypothetical protein